MRETGRPVSPRIGSREEIYRNKYQGVYKVRIDFDDHAKEIYVTDYGYRVGVVVEGAGGILLTHQYRYLIDRVSWEIPGGKVDAGEDLEDAVLRECLEETGVLCGKLRPLLAFHPGLDTLYNPTQIYYTNAYEEKSAAALHKDEVCGRSWVPFDECIAMISSRVIVDSLSVIALLSYKTFVRSK